MKFKAAEFKGKTVEEIEKILTEKLTPEERAKMEEIEKKWQIEECLNGRR